MRLFRYVENVEWDDISASGCLRPGPNSCGSGKWLAKSEGAAWEWGRALDDGFPGRVVILEVDEKVVDGSHSIESLDGIGAAVYVDDLAAVKVVGAEARK